MTWATSKELWDLARVQAWLTKIALGCGRVEMPLLEAPIVDVADAAASTAPAPTPAPPGSWEVGWNDEDEAIYQNVIAAWDGNWRHLPVASAGVLFPDVTARCLLRFIESCPDPTVAADLRRFQARAAQREEVQP